MALIEGILRERPPIRGGQAAQAGWLVVGIVCIGAFLGQLDASIVSLALPTLETAFHEDIATVSWVAVSYLLTVATMVAVFGRLADIHGRKTLYTLGFVVFITGSALCGAAPTLVVLIAMRIVQGVGAAMLQANSVAIITASVEKSQLGRAIGIQGAAQAVGLSVGPAVGGLIISSLGWRWIFYVSVPAGLLGALLGWLFLPVTGRQTAVEPFDWKGAAFFAPAVAGFMVALTYGQQLGWLSPTELALGAGVIVLGGLFVRDQVRERHPLIDLSLFRDRYFSGGIVAALLSYTVLFGAFFVLPFFLERVRHQSPAAAGLLLVPVPVALSLVAPVGGWLADRIGVRIPTIAGMGMTTIALGLLAFTHVHTEYLFTAGALALLGLGLGLFTPPNNASIMASAPRQRIGVAGGLLNTTRSIGTALGVALCSAVLAWQLSDLAHSALGTSGVSSHLLAIAFRHTLWFLAGIAALTTVVTAIRAEGRTHDVKMM